MSRPDALRTTSIEAATTLDQHAAQAVARARGRTGVPWPSDYVAARAVLGVAVPSTRRAAHSEAIAQVEAAPGQHEAASCWVSDHPERWISRDALLGRLQWLRDTQAPT